jgi:hypothetical protein
MLRFLHLVPPFILFANPLTGFVSEAPLTIPIIVMTAWFILPFWWTAFRAPKVERVLIVLLLSVVVSCFFATGIRELVFNAYYAGIFICLAFYIVLARSPWFRYSHYIFYCVIAMGTVLVMSMAYYFMFFLNSPAMFVDFRYSFFFDDKSHFSVYIGFFLFTLGCGLDLCVELSSKERWGRLRRLAISVGAIVIMGIALFMSTTTLSRLGVLFFPMIGFILYQLIRLNLEGMVGSKQSRILSILLLLLPGSMLIFVAWVTGGFDEVDSSFFRRLGRLSALMEDNSFASHVMLIQLAVEAKVFNVWNMLFGVGLGNFQHSLLNTGGVVYVIKYQSLVQNLYVGYMPAHSVWASIFVELNIVAFMIISTVISYYTILSLYLRRFDAFIFLVGIFLSSMFYSTINEAFYIVIWITVIASLERTRGRMFSERTVTPDVSYPVMKGT